MRFIIPNDAVLLGINIVNELGQIVIGEIVKISGIGKHA